MASIVRAAICREFGAPLSIENLRLANPKPGEIEVELDAVAICHSDISYADGGWGGDLPAVFGHEAAGRVTALGDGVAESERLAIGDAVVVTLIRSCGACPSCVSGRHAVCERPRDELAHPLSTPEGEPVAQSMCCGAFAEKVVVDLSQVAKIPAEMPRDSACLLSCGVITGIGAAVNTAKLRAGQDVVVIGAGGVGLNAIQGARIAGARRIVAVDLNKARLDDARVFGATDTVLATGDAPWKDARRAMGRGADVALVAVGAIQAVEAAPRYLARGGVAVLVGMPHSGERAAYEPVVLSATGQGIVGSKMGDAIVARDIPWMVDLYFQGRLKLDELVSRRWALDEINEAIADTRAGNARRNVVVFGERP